MTEIRFCISDEDADRLFLIKDLQGRADLTANDFARSLLEEKLYSLFPAVPEFDENGKAINADRYKGRRA